MGGTEQLAWVLGIGFVIFWLGGVIKKRQNIRKGFPEPYRSIKNALWQQWELIYGYRALCFVYRVEEHPFNEMPSDHPAVWWQMGDNTIHVCRDGYAGRTKLRWFAGELHNVIRYELNLPYRPTDKADIDNFVRAASLMEGIE